MFPLCEPVRVKQQSDPERLQRNRARTTRQLLQEVMGRFGSSPACAFHGPEAKRELTNFFHRRAISWAFY